VRARIGWKYLLGLELTDPGFDHSVLCEFRARLLEGGAEERLLPKLLDRCRELGLLKARGRQRTDATPGSPSGSPLGAEHVLASIRVLNRLELLGETLRAALNELAAVAPDWLREVAPEGWYRCYARRVEDGRLPRAAAEREAYARTVGEDGFALLDQLDRPETPEGLQRLPAVEVLRQVWARHFERKDVPAAACSSGPRRRSRPRRSRSSHPTTQRCASAPARASPGPATSCTRSERNRPFGCAGPSRPGGGLCSGMT
jgi:transposase